MLCETFARSNFNPKNPQSRHPRESGDPSKWLSKMDSRFRGNDGIGYLYSKLSRITFRVKVSIN